MKHESEHGEQQPDHREHERAEPKLGALILAETSILLEEVVLVHSLLGWLGYFLLKAATAPARLMI